MQPERRRWRLGRHNKQIIYRQDGDLASDDDRLVLVAFDPAEAACVVELLNAAEPERCMGEDHVNPHRGCIMR